MLITLLCSLKAIFIIPDWCNDELGNSQTLRYLPSAISFLSTGSVWKVYGCGLSEGGRGRCTGKSHHFCSITIWYKLFQRSLSCCYSLSVILEPNHIVGAFARWNTCLQSGAVAEQCSETTKTFLSMWTLFTCIHYYVYSIMYTDGAEGNKQCVLIYMLYIYIYICPLTAVPILFPLYYLHSCSITSLIC